MDPNIQLILNDEIEKLGRIGVTFFSRVDVVEQDSSQELDILGRQLREEHRRDRTRLKHSLAISST